MKYLPVFLFLLAGIVPVSAQSCFEKFFTTGRKLYDSGQADHAIDQFKAARICATGAQLDSVDAWIARSNMAYIENLTKARDEAQSNARRAAATALASKAWNAYRTDHTLALRIAAAALKNDPGNTDIQQTIRSIVNAGASFYRVTLKSQEFAVYALAFSPNSKSIALGTWDGSVICYDLTGKPVFQALSASRYFMPNGHSGTAHALAWSPDGAFLLSTGLDGVVKKWEAGTGNFLKNVARVRAETYDLEISPDGNNFLTASRDSAVRIWDWNGKTLKTLRGHMSDVNAACYAPNQQYIATAGKDGLVIVWDTAGNIVRRFDHHAVVNSVVFSSDNQMILTGCADNTAKLWNLDGTLLTTYGGHGGWVRSAIFSPDGKYVLTGSWDNTVKIWSIDGSEINTLAGHWEKVEAVAWSPDNQNIATGGYDFTAKLWDVPLNLKQTLNRHTSSINTVTVSPDGQKILTGGQDLVAKIWGTDANLQQDLTGHTDELYAVGFLPDGKKAITAGKDRTVRIWDAATGKGIKILEGHTQAIGDIACSSDGKWIATGEHNGFIRLYDAEGNVVKTWRGHKKRITAMQFAPDNQHFVTGSRDSTAVIWNIEGARTQTIVNDTWINCLTYTPDGKFLYTGGREYKIKRWRISDATLDKIFYGHTEEVYAVAVLPKGDKLVSGSWDSSAKIWDTSGVVLHNVVHADAIFDAAVSPKGDYFVTGSRDNIARIYDLNGKLLNSIGIDEEQNYAQLLKSPAIENLNSLPFSFIRYGIPLEYLEMVFSDSPEGLALQANEFLKIGKSQIENLESGLVSFGQSQKLYLEARQKVSATAVHHLDSCLAECYRWQTNHLIANRKFTEALESAQAGLQYYPLEYLHIFSVITALYAGKYDMALSKALSLNDQALKTIGFYKDYKEAFDGELYYFHEFGIFCPDEERFLKAIGF